MKVLRYTMLSKWKKNLASAYPPGSRGCDPLFQLSPHMGGQNSHQIHLKKNCFLWRVIVGHWDYSKWFRWCPCQDNSYASHTVSYLYIYCQIISWYLGLALSFGIRSKALKVEEILQFKVVKQIIAWKYRNIWFGQIDDSGWLALRFCPATTQFQATREAQ